MKFFIGNWKMFGVPKSINILSKINFFYSKDKNRNKYRVIITPPFTLIENYAKYLADKDVFKHSSQKNQGENLYYEYNSASITTNPLERASSSWLDEKKDYKYSKIGDGKNTFSKIGHYTQMIWKNTTKVGLVAFVNKEGEVYVVARYYPAGNMIGKYPY